jgi:hypothetical protein
MFFVLLGSFLYLAALGPALNLSAFKRRGRTPHVDSLLFFQRIAEVPSEEWAEYWNAPVEDLEEEMTKHYIKETHLISEKTWSKVIWMSTGSKLFAIAFVPLSALIIGLYAPDTWLVQFLIRLSIASFAVMAAYEAYIRPRSRRARVFLTVLFLLAAGMLLIWLLMDALAR